MNAHDEHMDDITRSLQGMQRASAPSHLFGKIEARIQAAKRTMQMVPQRTVYLAAASLLLLITINMLAAGGYKKHTQSSNAMQQLVEYYGLTENDRL
jgi:hypothetical protein